MTDNPKAFKEAGPALGFVFGAGVFGYFLWAAAQQGMLAVLLVLVGGLLGWAAGILITPATQNEVEKFAEYGKALATFVTGYLVAKLDKLFDKTVGDISDFNSPVLIYLLLFVGSFVLGGLSTFIWRRYVSG